MENAINNSCYLLCVAILLLFSSCSKHAVKPSAPGQTPNNTYQPITKGSTWVYAYTSNGITDTATTTMTGLVNSYGGEKYYEASIAFKLHNFPDVTDYFSQDGHAYKTLSISKTDTLNLYFFNDTTSLNNTWTAKVNNPGIINGQQARLVGDIVEQNISLSVQGKTYTGVTHSKIYLQYYYNNYGYNTAEIYDFFVVKGIGAIEIFTANSSGVTSSQALISYSIK